MNVCSVAIYTVLFSLFFPSVVFEIFFVDIHHWPLHFIFFSLLKLLFSVLIINKASAQGKLNQLS